MCRERKKKNRDKEKNNAGWNFYGFLLLFLQKKNRGEKKKEKKHVARKPSSGYFNIHFIIMRENPS